MKKIILISLFLISSNANAIVFEDCYDASNIAFDAKTLPDHLKSIPLDLDTFLKDIKEGNFQDKNTYHVEPEAGQNKKTINDYKLEAFSKYDEKYKKKHFENDTSVETRDFRLLKKSLKIVSTVVYSDEGLEGIRDSFSKFEQTKDIKFEKINKEYLKVNKVTKNYIEAELLGYKTVTYYRFNLKNGTYLSSFDKYFKDGYVGLHHCKLSGIKKKSHYLDYWWAVILIIAITFFIFTQSGKRLKKIRRK